MEEVSNTVLAAVELPYDYKQGISVEIPGKAVKTVENVEMCIDQSKFDSELISKLFYEASNTWNISSFNQLMSLCDKGSLLAQGFVMRMYAFGSGLAPKDTELAIALGSEVIPYLLAQDQEKTVYEAKEQRYIWYLLSSLYMKGLTPLPLSPEQTFYYALRAAEEGKYAPAQNLVGYCYEKGFGVAVSVEKGLSYYTLAASQNHAAAQYNLGLYYKNLPLGGTDPSEDLQKAYEFFHRSATQNNIDSQYFLGFFHQEGLIKGLKKDEKEAFQWYLRSAQQGNMYAQFCVGRYYRLGLAPEGPLESEKAPLSALEDVLEGSSSSGGKRDSKKSLYWLLQSAKQGHTTAMHHVAIMYSKHEGCSDVEEADDVMVKQENDEAEESRNSPEQEAYYWFTQCIGGGSEGSKQQQTDLRTALLTSATTTIEPGTKSDVTTDVGTQSVATTADTGTQPSISTDTGTQFKVALTPISTPSTDDLFGSSTSKPVITVTHTENKKVVWSTESVDKEAMYQCGMLLFKSLLSSGNRSCGTSKSFFDGYQDHGHHKKTKKNAKQAMSLNKDLIKDTALTKASTGADYEYHYDDCLLAMLYFEMAACYDREDSLTYAALCRLALAHIIQQTQRTLKTAPQRPLSSSSTSITEFQRPLSALTTTKSMFQRPLFESALITTTAAFQGPVLQIEAVFQPPSSQPETVFPRPLLGPCSSVSGMVREAMQQLRNSANHKQHPSALAMSALAYLTFYDNVGGDKEVHRGSGSESGDESNNRYVQAYRWALLALETSCLSTLSSSSASSSATASAAGGGGGTTTTSTSVSTWVSTSTATATTSLFTTSPTPTVPRRRTGGSTGTVPAGGTTAANTSASSSSASTTTERSTDGPLLPVTGLALLMCLSDRQHRSSASETSVRFTSHAYQALILIGMLHLQQLMPAEYCDARLGYEALLKAYSLHQVIRTTVGIPSASSDTVSTADVSAANSVATHATISVTASSNLPSSYIEFIQCLLPALFTSPPLSPQPSSSAFSSSSSAQHSTTQSTRAQADLAYLVYNLALCHYHGLETSDLSHGTSPLPKDLHKAFDYFTLAATVHPVRYAEDRQPVYLTEALYCLGWCYRYGEGTNKQRNKAVEYFQQAAKQGSRQACEQLALCYRRGKGVTRDLNESKRYQQLAREYREAEEAVKVKTRGI